MIEFSGKTEHVPSYKLAELPNGQFVIERYWTVITPAKTAPYASRADAERDLDFLTKALEVSE